MAYGFLSINICISVRDRYRFSVGRQCDGSTITETGHYSREGVITCGQSGNGLTHVKCLNTRSPRIEKVVAIRVGIGIGGIVRVLYARIIACGQTIPAIGVAQLKTWVNDGGGIRGVCVA